MIRFFNISIKVLFKLTPLNPSAFTFDLSRLSDSGLLCRRQ